MFEGNAPADVRENAPLRALAPGTAPAKPPATPRIWLGAPNSIKGPTEAMFQRQSGNNLLIVGQSEEPRFDDCRRRARLSGRAISERRRALLLLDSTPPGAPQREFLERVIRAVPHEIVHGENGEIAATS